MLREVANKAVEEGWMDRVWQGRRRKLEVGERREDLGNKGVMNGEEGTEGRKEGGRER